MPNKSSGSITQHEWTESGFLELVELTFGEEAARQARIHVEHTDAVARDNKFFQAYLEQHYPEFVRDDPLLCE